MKRARLPLAAMVGLTLAGCCARHVGYVPVREQEFRTQKQHLPLDEAARNSVLQFLSAGGDNDKLQNTKVDPQVELRYRPLLTLLSDPSHLALEDLTTKGTFSRWFRGSIIRQVIDAREDSTPPIDPAAASDGTYWWIFYPHNKRLEALTITRSATSERPAR